MEQNHQTGATVDTARPQRGRGRSRNTWRRDLDMWTAGYKYMQLEEDGGGSTR